MRPDLMRSDLMITAVARPNRHGFARLGHRPVPAHRPAKRLRDGPRTLDRSASSPAGRAVGRDVATRGGQRVVRSSGQRVLSDGRGVGEVIVPGRVAALEKTRARRANGTAEVSA